MAAADVQGRSSQDQFYQIRPEILQGVAPRTAVTRGGCGRQDSLKRSRSKLKRKLQGKAQFGQPARPLRPVIPLLGRNPGRGGNDNANPCRAKDSQASQAGGPRRLKLKLTKARSSTLNDVLC